MAVRSALRNATFDDDGKNNYAFNV